MEGEVVLRVVTLHSVCLDFLVNVEAKLLLEAILILLGSFESTKLSKLHSHFMEMLSVTKHSASRNSDTFRPKGQLDNANLTPVTGRPYGADTEHGGRGAAKCACLGRR